MPLAQQLVDTYLSYNICTLPPLTLGCGQVPPNRGALYRYVAAYAGDAVFLANKRQQCATWAANGVPAYCYRMYYLNKSLPDRLLTSTSTLQASMRNLPATTSTAVSLTSKK